MSSLNANHRSKGLLVSSNEKPGLFFISRELKKGGRILPKTFLTTLFDFYMNEGGFVLGMRG